MARRRRRLEWTPTETGRAKRFDHPTEFGSDERKRRCLFFDDVDAVKESLPLGKLRVVIPERSYVPHRGHRFFTGKIAALQVHHRFGTGRRVVVRVELANRIIREPGSFESR